MGPLAGVRVVELAGIGPLPMCCMLLADLGADVLRVDRMDAGGDLFPLPARFQLLSRGRRSVCLDLKAEKGREAALSLAERADIFVEGFRPGVAERLGLGPKDVHARSPKVVYGRMTGWGQEGPLAATAGHDIDYLALTGALHAIGRAGEAPVPPLNLVADFGGGAMYLAVGLLSALVERQRSGLGQVVDCAMVDGAAHLTTFIHGLLAAGAWRDQRGVNALDTGAPFYDVYKTSDGKYLAVGALEPRFFASLAKKVEMPEEERGAQWSPASWPKLRVWLTARFLTKTRDEWCAIFDGSDACVAPVLSWAEAKEHPHAKARGTFIEIDGVVQPAPAPRFSRSAPDTPSPPPELGKGTFEALEQWGFSPEERDTLRVSGAAR
jgi:alpha-methylacyl-CoA racemase